MKGYNRDQWMRELAPLAIWDPAEEGLNPTVKFNVTKITHLTKRFLAEFVPSHLGENWETEFGTTYYDVAKCHPTANNMMLLAGIIDLAKYKELIKKGVGGNKLYYPCIENPEEFIKTCRDLSTELTAVLAQPAEVTLGSLGKLELPNTASLTAINSLLQADSLPVLEDLFKELKEIETRINDTIQEKDNWKEAHEERVKEADRLKAEITNLMAKAMTATTTEYTSEKGEIPDGKVVYKKVKDIWTDITFKDTKLAEMEVPFWEWEDSHPDVPAIDSEYIFREKHLRRTLYAIITNQREYIQGHTGSGKTTLVEQVAARLQWPFIRINFDSEITRMDLIGRDTLVSDEDGKVTSQFEDGMLPTAMSGPYICCFDELDFVRPDVAYVMQAALEGNGLRITEDGDRLVKPHPMFRMFGTGNTVGQGDEHGMYQGARPQSMAFLDRFTIWDKIDYLTADERKSLVERRYPALDDDSKAQVLQYTTEHLEAFTQGKVIQPISPRGMLAICQAAIMLGSVKEALEMSVLDRANTEDRATLKGLVDRVAR